MTTPDCMRKARQYMLLAFGFCLWAHAHNAHALGATCTVSSTGMAFGIYQPVTFAGKLTSLDKLSTANVKVVCTGLLALGGYTISLGPSTYGTGNLISTRYLNNTTNGGPYMAYNIYTESTYTTIWGNGTTGSLVTGTSALIIGTSTNNHTVYGKVLAGQNTLKAGSFSDGLTMTLTYTP